MSSHHNRLARAAERTLIAAICAVGMILLAESGAGAQTPDRSGGAYPLGFNYGAELGYGWNYEYFGVTPGFNVNDAGIVGGVYGGVRMPINATPDSLVFPVGGRIGVLGGSMNGSSFYPTTGFTYSVKMPVAVYAEAEFANPIVSSLITRLLPNMPITIFSSAGIAGVDQNFGWSMPGLSGSTNTFNFAVTTSVRVEWPIATNLDMYAQWRTFYITPFSVGVPGTVNVDGITSVVTIGAQFFASEFATMRLPRF